MKEYRKYISLSRISLTKDDLSDLVSLIVSSSSIGDLKIDSKIGDLNISEKSLTDFFSHKLPDTIAEVSVQFFEWSSPSRQIEKSISISLGVYSSYLQISGTDQTWVIGKTQELIT